MTQKTFQTIGKTKFIVVSHFKEEAPDIKEKIKGLLVREMLNKTVARTFDK